MKAPHPAVATLTLVALALGVLLLSGTNAAGPPGSNVPSITSRRTVNEVTESALAGNVGRALSRLEVAGLLRLHNVGLPWLD